MATGSAGGHSVLPDGLRNPHFEALVEDHFFHIGNEHLNRDLDLRAKLGDVRFVLMGGTPDRMQHLSEKLSGSFGWPREPLGSAERYTLFKTGPVMCVSHGMGMPSISILLHELTKVLHYAGCVDVVYIRIGTCGGVGVLPGTLVVASEALNPDLERTYEMRVLGKKKFFDTGFDARTVEQLALAGKRAKLPVVVAKTLTTSGFYEEQGRLDGALETGYSEADKMAWLQELYDIGVRNIEMEAAGLAAFCNRTGIRCGVVCAALIDRLKGDQPMGQVTGEQIAQWNSDAQELVIEWLRERLAEGRVSTLAKNQVTNCDQFVLGDNVPVLDMKDWTDGTPEGKHKIIREMSRACQESGFFFLRNHGVSGVGADGVFDASKRFFDQELAEKNRLHQSKDYLYGYENSEVLMKSEGGNHGDTWTAPDLKETFSVCLGPEGSAHPSSPAVRWPDEPSDMREKFTAYYRECEQVVFELMKIAALALELPEDWFLDKLSQHVAALRSLSYPETRALAPASGQLRASPHTDYGLFTLLQVKAEGSEGLQLMKADGGWLDVNIPADCFTVNVGDLFCRWTNDKWRSTRHRVVVQDGHRDNRRQSVAFFLNPNPDAIVSTMRSCITEERPNKYVDSRAGDYLALKHKSAMGYM